MSRQRVVRDDFWNDNWVDNLDPSEKLLFLYLLTNVKMNLIGTYQITTKRMAFETGFDKDMVDKILNRFVEDGKIMRIGEYIILVNSLKYQTPNPNMVKSMKKEVDALPSEVRNGLQMVCKGFPILFYSILFNLNDDSDESLASAEPQLDSGSSEIQELVYEPLEENQPRYKSKFKSGGGFGNKEVSTLLALGKKFGFTTGKLENYAVARLVKRYGFSDVKDKLEKSQKLRRVAFAPQITSMMDLEKKWAKLDDYLIQNDSSGVPKSVMDEIVADTEKYKQMDVPQNEIDDIIEKRIKRYKESGDWR